MEIKLPFWEDLVLMLLCFYFRRVLASSTQADESHVQHDCHKRHVSLDARRVEAVDGVLESAGPQQVHQHQRRPAKSRFGTLKKFDRAIHEFCNDEISWSGVEAEFYLTPVTLDFCWL